MPERHREEIILARWWVGADELRPFTEELRRRAKSAFVLPGLRKECEKCSAATGAEVVLREDAIFIGRWSAGNYFSEFRVHDTWMHCVGDEGHELLVPVARSARTDAERVAAHLTAYCERLNAEAARQYAEERARPTWNNRALNFAEAHFVWLVLGFFFLLLPLVVLLFGFLRGSLSH